MSDTWTKIVSGVGFIIFAVIAMGLMMIVVSACTRDGSQEDSNQWSNTSSPQIEKHERGDITILEGDWQGDWEGEAWEPGSGPRGVEIAVYHDDARGVTCWVAREEIWDYDSSGLGIGIVCIPDDQLPPRDK